MEFLLLFSFFSSQLKYILSSHSSLRSLISHQIIPICKYTSAFSSPFISSFDWGLFEGLDVCPTYSFQVITTSCLTGQPCPFLPTVIKIRLLPTCKAVLLCHLASLSSLCPREILDFRSVDLLLWALCLIPVRRLSTNPDSLTPAAFILYLTKFASWPLL